MNINLIPFVLAPGIAGLGYVIGGVVGAGAAVSGWIVTVAAATTYVLLRRVLRRTESQPEK